MIIERRASNFSQFSDDLWLTFQHGVTSVGVDIDQSELLQTAYMLVDIADDCLRKSKKETDRIQEKLAEVMEELSQ